MVQRKQKRTVERTQMRRQKNDRKEKTAVYGKDGPQELGRAKMKKGRTKRERGCQTRTRQE